MALVAVTAMTMTLSATSGAMADHSDSPGTAAPAAALCTGTATTNPVENSVIDGNVPMVDDGPRFDWQLHADCGAAVNSDGSIGLNDVELDISGEGAGWCDLSGGYGGSGTLGSAHLDNLTWTNVGSVHRMSFSHDAGGMGTGQAVAQFSGGGSCLTGGATSFDVTMAIWLRPPDPTEPVGELVDHVLGIVEDGAPEPFGHPSAECDDGPVVADGFSHGTYVKLRADQEGDDTLVCFRADGDSTGFGGRVDIADPLGAGSLDVVEEIVCTAEPLLAGEVGDPDDPATYAPYEITVEDTGSEVRLCVLVGDVERTVTTAASPEATFDVLLDDPDPYATAEPWPAGPSATCAASDGHQRHLDVETADDSRLRLASLVEGDERAHVCARADGPAGIGGVLTVDVSGSPGAQPVVETGSDTAGCEVNVWSNTQPVEVSVTRSATGELPAAVCVEVEGELLRVTAGTEGEPVLPTVSWTPDPGTPG